MLPTAKAGGFSVLSRDLRHGSPTALTEPFSVLGGVVVPVEAGSAVWAAMPADGETLLDHDTTPATHLTGVGGVDWYGPATGACCLVRKDGEDGEERAPPRIANTLGEVVVPEHVGRLYVFMIDRVIGADERERRFVVEVLALPSHRLMRLGKECYRFASTVTTTLPPSDPPLGSRERAFRLPVPSRIEDTCAIRKRRKGFYAKVDPGLLSGW
jgi:hypothetical protein